MRTNLVTGGAGFIGSHLVQALVARGDRVRVVDDLSTGHADHLSELGPRIEFIEGSVTDMGPVTKATSGVDCVFHLAALPSVPRSVAAPLESHDVAATGTLTVLDAARRASVRRFVYAASSSAYGNLPFGTKRETDLPQPLSPYSAAKLTGELYCRAYAATHGLETVCLRYFNVFGPRQDQHSPYAGVIPRFVAALLHGRAPTIFGDGRQQRDFCYVDNVVAANLLAADAPARVAGRTYNIGCGSSSSLLDVVAILNRLMGTQVAPQFAPPRPGDLRDSCADISAARADLCYQPSVSFEEGLRRTVDYYRQSFT